MSLRSLPAAVISSVKKRSNIGMCPGLTQVKQFPHEITCLVLYQLISKFD